MNWVFTEQPFILDTFETPFDNWTPIIHANVKKTRVIRIKYILNYIFHEREFLIPCKQFISLHNQEGNGGAWRWMKWMKMNVKNAYSLSLICLWIHPLEPKRALGNWQITRGESNENERWWTKHSRDVPSENNWEVMNDWLANDVGAKVTEIGKRTTKLIDHESGELRPARTRRMKHETFIDRGLFVAKEKVRRKIRSRMMTTFMTQLVSKWNLGAKRRSRVLRARKAPRIEEKFRRHGEMVGSIGGVGNQSNVLHLTQNRDSMTRDDAERTFQNVLMKKENGKG